LILKSTSVVAASKLQSPSTVKYKEKLAEVVVGKGFPKERPTGVEDFAYTKRMPVTELPWLQLVMEKF
jgi:hypothetical protein